MSKNALFVTVRTHQHLLYQGEVSAVSSINSKGKFDVLPEHAHFISVIEQEIVILERTQKRKRFGIEIGVIHVEENTVNIYLEGEAKQ